MNGANSGKIGAVYETHFYYQHRKIVSFPFCRFKKSHFYIGTRPMRRQTSLLSRHAVNCGTIYIRFSY